MKNQPWCTGDKRHTSINHACSVCHNNHLVSLTTDENQKEGPEEEGDDAGAGGKVEEEEEEDPMDAFYPQTLAGFITVLTEEGDMIYLTENVSRHIGITQVRHEHSPAGQKEDQ